MREKPTVERVKLLYEKGVTFNQQVGLYDTVRKNENFFIGKQWEGVEANGLPTPVFNFLKRTTLFQVSTITSDNIAMKASPLASTSEHDLFDIDQVSDVINKQFSAIMEQTQLIWKLREFARNAAVDGDGCIYVWFDPDVENGQRVKGEIAAEVIENTNVIFGNPNSRDVQSQRHILLVKRMCVEDARELARKNGATQEEAEQIRPDEEDVYNRNDTLTDDKVTVITYLYKDYTTRPSQGAEAPAQEGKESDAAGRGDATQTPRDSFTQGELPRQEEEKTVWKFICTRNAVIEQASDTKLKLFPVVWLNWDYIQDSYHGQAMISGLIPNQIFVNKLFAMSMLSMMTTAYPKIIYDKTRIPKWDSRVGAAIGVAGGDMNSVARIMDPAQISPQIAQFIEMAVDMTQSFIGVSDVAMGDNTNPDNTSAIIALQRASNVPMENTKQNLYRCVEQLGRIFIDHMRCYYGVRNVQITMKMPEQMPLGIQIADELRNQNVPFDFKVLNQIPVSIQIDVGASSYWSEIASMQTLDNLNSMGKISMEDYLERIPDGYIAKKQELIEKYKQQEAAQMAAVNEGQGGNGQLLDTRQKIPMPERPGNGALQRAVMEGPVV